MLAQDRIVELHHLDAANHESRVLESGKNLAGQVFLNRVGFEKNQRGFKCHARASRPVSADVQALSTAGRSGFCHQMRPDPLDQILRRDAFVQQIKRPSP